jgi:hypothetical protein
MRILRSVRSILLIIVGFALFVSAVSAQKADVKALYEKKFAVAIREGLAVGLCSALNPRSPVVAHPILPVQIEGGSAVFHEETGIHAMGTGCVSVAPDPVAKGEMLLIQRIWFHDGIHMEILSQPREVERTMGAAFELKRRRTELGLADLHFKGVNEKDASSVISEIGAWIRAFDSKADAAAFAASLLAPPPPKEIKIGMTQAEVESAMGPPQTKVDLGDKILYRYKDLTVEFRAGKVVDVR